MYRRYHSPAPLTGPTGRLAACHRQGRERDIARLHLAALARTTLLWLLLLVPTLLLARGGMQVWASARRAYPDAVYYCHLLMLSSPDMWQTSVEVWEDPQRHRLYARAQSAAGTTTWLSTNGFTYQGSSDTGIGRVYLWPSMDGVEFMVLPGDVTTDSGVPTPYSEPPYQVQVDRALAAGGWARVFSGWTSQYHGRVVPARVAGQQVLQFAPSPNFTVWLDRQTRQPVQVQYAGFIYGPNETIRFLRWSRLAPYSLPATFFDSFPTHHSLWARLTSWLHAHLPTTGVAAHAPR